MKTIEIERKFLIQTLPNDLETYPHKEIEQGYINREPVIRIRRLDDCYILTCKGEGLLSREEFEHPLTKEIFEHLKPKTDGIFIQKTRYFIPFDDNLTIELDLFHGKLAPLILAEVEFPTEQAANEFIPPAWFGEEVTNSPKYHNSNLSALTDSCF